jgi:heme/copper-type cytochrome/quinol oxidase subunit 1
MFAISFVSSNAAFDVTRGDTYYVYSYSLIYGLFALLLLVFWLIYILLHRWLLSKKLASVHILSTLLPIIIFFTLVKLDWGLQGVPRRYYAISTFNAKPDWVMLIPYLAIIVVFFIGQLCFLVNLVGGTIKSIWGRRVKPTV